MTYRVIHGVYIIQSVSHPDRVYVGSAKNIKQRWYNHRQDLRKNKHHSSALQNHYNKYGKNDFVFEIIESGEYIDKNHILAREQGWFGHFEYKDTGKPFFNMLPLAGSCEGIKRSPEQRKRIGDMHKGNTYVKGKHWTATEEAKQNVSIGLLAFYQTEEGKLSAKLNGQKRKGKKKHPGFGEKLSKAISGEKHHQFGKPLKKETRLKMSIKRMGKKQSEETKRKRVVTIQNTKKKKKIALIIGALLNRVA